ncbi:RTA1 like protein-domain-containing protein [Dactylonectria estremocensis]|uniref:RTA1 like protein-domain-containing protein n=1 Tax=Dactylonectria estremocensis TaxID=1079267 RepID=A0A9P9F3D5_9HYPO|nr:RTA1 like protein-domain-containing protein [Dactylonectria estremocensis]
MADSDSVWMYNPSFALSVIGTVVYGIIFLIISFQTLIKYRAWFFLVVPIGAALEVVAYILRTYSTKNQTALIPFILTLTLTVLAPIFIAAGNYLLISRLILSVLPPSSHRILKIPGRRLTPIFVICDVIAFLVQGSGSSIASADEWTGNGEKIGRRILIGGLVFQLVAFALFLSIFHKFHVLGNRKSVEDAPKGWQMVVRAVYISSALIMVRCIYRVCEFSEGMDGYAFRTEWLFWVFECLPMVGAIGVFCIYHPSRCLGQHRLWRKALRCDETELSGESSTMA